ENQPPRQALDLAQVDAQARRPLGRVLQPLRHPVQLEQLDELRQVYPPVELFQFGLEFHVLQLLLLQVLAQLVQLDHPLVDDRLDGLGKQVVGEERLDQSERRQRPEQLPIERSSRFEFHAWGSSARVADPAHGLQQRGFLASYPQRPPWSS